MNTSLFSNMFKSLFGEQITPTSDQFVPITASDGTPAGISSMANLQSLLGAFGNIKEASDSSDYDAGDLSANLISYQENGYTFIQLNLCINSVFRTEIRFRSGSTANCQIQNKSNNYPQGTGWKLVLFGD